MSNPVSNPVVATRRWLQAGNALWQRTQETARLMVGVGDYPRYLAHMAARHPDVAPMSETAYFRYCQESRYPGKDGAIRRCPC